MPVYEVTDKRTGRTYQFDSRRDLTPEQIREYVRQLRPGEPVEQGPGLVEDLPTAGGIVGGYFGGPAGAGVGGMVGEALRQAIRAAQGAPSVPAGQRVRQVGTRGLMDATIQKGAGLIAKVPQVMRKFGGRLVENSLLPKEGVLDDAMRAFKTGTPQEGGEAIARYATQRDLKFSPAQHAALKAEQGIDKEALRGVLRRTGRATVSPERIAEGLDPLKRKYSFRAAASAEDVGKVRGVEESFRANPHVTRQVSKRVQRDTETGLVDPSGRPLTRTETVREVVPVPRRVSLPRAQRMKEETQQQLRDKYGEMGSAETEATKKLAQGLREDIETGASSRGFGTQVQDLNQRMAQRGVMMDALSDALTRAGKRAAMSVPEASVSSGVMSPRRLPFALAVLANRPGVAFPLGKTLTRTGEQTTLNEQALAQLTRLALALAEQKFGSTP